MKKEVMTQLHQIGAIKQGSFLLKSGITSPIYVDLRSIISYPYLLRQITELLWNEISLSPCDLVCGVPYTALPLATAISLLYEKPMILRRKEIKEYGTKKKIEGIYHKGQVCSVIEDVVTTGSSVIETIKDLEDAGLRVSQVVAVLDRSEGNGKRTMKEGGYHFSSIFQLSDLLP